MNEASDTAKDTSMRSVIGRMALRFAIIGLIAFGAHLALNGAMSLADRIPGTAGALARCSFIIAAIVLYALLLAVPFVPGVEIGIALLIMRGAEIAPAIYAATVLGLTIAFLLGRLVPLVALRQLLFDIRLMQAVRLLEVAGPMTPQERLTALRERLPSGFGHWLINARYLAFALLLNLPLNAFLGGGGGLSMMAGMSGLMRLRPTLLVIALAVLPVPLLVWIMGAGVLTGGAAPDAN